MLLGTKSNPATLQATCSRSHSCLGGTKIQVLDSWVHCFSHYTAKCFLSWKWNKFCPIEKEWYNSVINSCMYSRNSIEGLPCLMQRQALNTCRGEYVGVSSSRWAHCPLVWLADPQLTSALLSCVGTQSNSAWAIGMWTFYLSLEGRMWSIKCVRGCSLILLKMEHII